MLTGSKASGEGDIRKRYYPRFQDQNRSHTEILADALASVAEREGMTAAQAAITWVASQGEDIIPYVGARSVARLEEALGAPFQLSASAIAAIDGAVPQRAVQGEQAMSN